MTPATIQQAPARSRYDDREVIETIKQTVAKGATDAQLKMFLEVCKRTGLDPFLKEVWYVPEKGIIMAGRDGYLRVANENPQFDGMETLVDRDANDKPIKATCRVWRKDRSHPITCEAYYSEYRKQSPVWTQYPSAMISKVAEVLALKRSFSINGVVSEEEIGFDGSGSKAAAQEVAREKIAKLEAGVPYAQTMPTVLEKQLADSLEVEKNNFKQMLNAFSALKDEFEKMGAKDKYYGFLGTWGYEHANEIRPLSKARKMYKELGVILSELREGMGVSDADLLYPEGGYARSTEEKSQ